MTSLVFSDHHSPTPVAAAARHGRSGWDRERFPWLRTEWVRVGAGILLIAVVGYVAWMLVFKALGVGAPTVGHRIANIVRFGTTIVVVAGWTAWRVRREERRLAAAREQIREEEAALREERWRATQAEGLAASARILAHELRNPLNAMALHGALVKRTAAKLGPEGESIHAATVTLDEQMRRVNELLESYLATSKAGAMTLATEPLALDAVAESAVREVEVALLSRGIRCHVHRSPGLPLVRGDRGKLGRAVQHLLHATAEAMTAPGSVPTGARVDIRASAEGNQVLLTVTDNGPGLADPDAAFRPFFNTKNAAGLGFAVVRDIVRAHRGEVGAANESPRGTRITIRLPRAEGEPR